MAELRSENKAADRKKEVVDCRLKLEQRRTAAAKRTHEEDNAAFSIEPFVEMQPAGGWKERKIKSEAHRPSFAMGTVNNHATSWRKDPELGNIVTGSMMPSSVHPRFN